VHGGTDGPKLILSSPKDGDEASFVGNVGTGIYEVAFRVDHDKAGSGTTPYGRIVWSEDFL
jgi:4-hydroxyphenylpyruvate dioxygenase-like putative hemolysin